MRFDTLVVPRGAETAAVRCGWRSPRPAFLSVPAGVSAAAALRDVAPIEIALVLGLCGALDPALRIGDAVVYAQIVAGLQTIQLDAPLVAVCSERLNRFPLRAAAVAQVVGDVAGKAALRAATGAAVIDMEAAALACELQARGARFAMVRIVSDDAASELPDLADVYDAQGALRPIALAFAFARAPLRSARFVLNVTAALAALRAAAHRLSVAT